MNKQPLATVFILFLALLGTIAFGSATLVIDRSDVIKTSDPAEIAFNERFGSTRSGVADGQVVFGEVVLAADENGETTEAQFTWAKIGVTPWSEGFFIFVLVLVLASARAITLLLPAVRRTKQLALEAVQDVAPASW